MGWSKRAQVSHFRYLIFDWNFIPTGLSINPFFYLKLYIICPKIAMPYFVIIKILFREFGNRTCCRCSTCRSWNTSSGVLYKYKFALYFKLTISFQLYFRFHWLFRYLMLSFSYFDFKTFFIRLTTENVAQIIRLIRDYCNAAFWLFNWMHSMINRSHVTDCFNFK